MHSWAELCACVYADGAQQSYIHNNIAEQTHNYLRGRYSQLRLVIASYVAGNMAGRKDATEVQLRSTLYRTSRGFPGSTSLSDITLVI